MAFEFVPILKGRYLTYAEYYTLLGSIGALFLGSLLLLVSLIFHVICRVRTDPTEKGESVNHANGNGHHLVHDVKVTLDGSYKVLQKKKTFKEFVDTATSLFTWNAFLFFAGIPCINSAFNVIHPLLAAVLAFSILFFRLLIGLYFKAPSSRKKDSRSQNVIRGIRISYQVHRFSTKMKFFAIVAFSIGLPFFYQDFCLSSFNGIRAGSIIPDELASVSTRFSRMINLPKMCPPGPPCHVFATLPENASNSILINVHTHVSVENVTLYYSPKHELPDNRTLGRFSAKVTSQKINRVEELGQRTVHIGHLSDMLPDTLYAIQVYYDGAIQATRNYKTLPGPDSNKEIKIAQAGDAGANSRSETLAEIIYSYEPDALFVGGDNAYDNGMTTCYFAWDYFMWMLERHSDTLGRMVPLVMSVGNHDVGLEFESERALDISDKGPWHFAFMAQETIPDEKNTSLRIAPQISERKSYSYHVLGNILFFNLDTGYIEPFAGRQQVLIDSLSQKYPNHTKIAMYHDPAYTCCGRIGKAHKYWVPYFDKHHFALGLENHRHAFKRTKPMINGKVHEKGTVYLGDGSWGAGGSNCKVTNATGNMEIMSNNVSHFWMLYVTNNNIRIKAVNNKAHVVDSSEIQLSSRRRRRL